MLRTHVLFCINTHNSEWQDTNQSKFVFYRLTPISKAYSLNFLYDEFMMYKGLYNFQLYSVHKQSNSNVSRKKGHLKLCSVPLSKDNVFLGSGGVDNLVLYPSQEAVYTQVVAAGGSFSKPLGTHLISKYLHVYNFFLHNRIYIYNIFIKYII